MISSHVTPDDQQNNNNNNYHLIKQNDFSDTHRPYTQYTLLSTRSMLIPNKNISHQRSTRSYGLSHVIFH